MIPRIYVCVILLVWLLSCSKAENNPSLLGKWYHASLDTKKLSGIGCNLKDTTLLYTKANTSYVYEFLEGGKMIIALQINGQTTSTTVDYKLENNNLSYTVNGTMSPAIKLSNISNDGWRFEQTNRSYCTNPYTPYTEYYNFKRY